MYERPRVNVKVEQGSTFTCPRGVASSIGISKRRKLKASGCPVAKIKKKRIFPLRHSCLKLLGCLWRRLRLSYSISILFTHVKQVLLTFNGSYKALVLYTVPSLQAVGFTQERRAAKPRGNWRRWAGTSFLRETPQGACSEDELYNVHVDFA